MSLYARDPSRQLVADTGRGPRLVLPPVAMVWRCLLSVDEYVAAGKEVEVPRPDCPGCGEVMRFRSGYGRHVRCGGGTGRRMWIRRVACVGCGRSHALLPSFLLERRLDVVEDIGAVIEVSATARPWWVVWRGLGMCRTRRRGIGCGVSRRGRRCWRPGSRRWRWGSVRGGYRRAGERCFGACGGGASPGGGRDRGVIAVVVGAGVAGHRRQVVGQCHGPTVDGPRRPSFDASSPLRGRTERQTTWTTTWPRRSPCTAGR